MIASICSLKQLPRASRQGQREQRLTSCKRVRSGWLLHISTHYNLATYAYFLLLFKLQLNLHGNQVHSKLRFHLFIDVPMLPEGPYCPVSTDRVENDYW